MILRGSNDERLEITVADLGPPGTPGDEDVLLNVTVVVGGYSAADQCWVVGSEWRGFMEDLRKLERTRRGQADLVGATPEKLAIRFAATDAAGHMSVAGTVGWHTPASFLHKLEFGFSFDPGVLANLVRELGGLLR